MLNCNNNDQILFEREVSNNSIKLNCVTESNPILCHFFESELYLLQAIHSCSAGQSSREFHLFMIHRIPFIVIFLKVPASSSIILAPPLVIRIPSPIYCHFFESELSHLSYVSPLFFWRTVGPSPMCVAYCGGYAKGAAMKRGREVWQVTNHSLALTYITGTIVLGGAVWVTIWSLSRWNDAKIKVVRIFMRRRHPEANTKEF